MTAKHARDSGSLDHYPLSRCAVQHEQSGRTRQSEGRSKSCGSLSGLADMVACSGMLFCSCRPSITSRGADRDAVRPHAGVWRSFFHRKEEGSDRNTDVSIL